MASEETLSRCDECCHPHAGEEQHVFLYADPTSITPELLDPITLDPIEDGVCFPGTPCEHSFSRSSISLALQRLQQCPLCRTPISMGQAMPLPLAFRRLIERVPVRCPFDRQDTQAHGLFTRETILDHLRACPNKEKQCPNIFNEQRCSRYLSPEDLAKHVGTCPLRTVVCDRVGGCGLPILASDAATHSCVAYLQTQLQRLELRAAEPPRQSGLPSTSCTLSGDPVWHFSFPGSSSANWLDADGNVLFHFNPRENESEIVMNSTVDGEWLHEERIPLLESQGSRFAASVTVTSAGFLVSTVDQGSQSYLFRHRRPWTSWASLLMDRTWGVLPTFVPEESVFKLRTGADRSGHVALCGLALNNYTDPTPVALQVTLHSEGNFAAFNSEIEGEWGQEEIVHLPSGSGPVLVHIHLMEEGIEVMFKATDTSGQEVRTRDPSVRHLYRHRTDWRFEAIRFSNGWVM